jgi:hypothetical protein
MSYFGFEVRFRTLLDLSRLLTVAIIFKAYRTNAL